MGSNKVFLIKLLNNFSSPPPPPPRFSATVYPLFLPSLTCSACPCPKDNDQLTGKLPILFPSLSVHLAWTIPQITDLFPYSQSLDSYLKNLFTLSFCHEHKLISTIQLGFLSHRSPSSAFSLQATLFTLFYKLINWLVFVSWSQEGLRLCSYKLLIDLPSLLFPPHLINGLHSYYLSAQQVIITGTSSSPPPMTSGVPQGFTVGPLLFIICIKGLCNVSLSASSKLIFFMLMKSFFFILSILFLIFLSSGTTFNCITTWLTSQYLTFNLINQNTWLFLINNPFLPCLSHSI